MCSSFERAHTCTLFSCLDTQPTRDLKLKLSRADRQKLMVFPQIENQPLNPVSATYILILFIVVIVFLGVLMILILLQWACQLSYILGYAFSSCFLLLTLDYTILPNFFCFNPCKWHLSTELWWYNAFLHPPQPVWLLDGQQFWPLPLAAVMLSVPSVGNFSNPPTSQNSLCKASTQETALYTASTSLPSMLTTVISHTPSGGIMGYWKQLKLLRKL